MPEIGAPTIDHCACRADLNTRAARNTGTLSKRNTGICHENTARSSFFEAKGEVTDQFVAGSYTTSAKNTTIVINNDIRMRGVYRVRLPVGLQRPVRHTLMIGGVLQLAISTADLAVRAEVVAFTKDQGQHEFAGIKHLFGIRFNDHIIVDWKGTGWL